MLLHIVTVLLFHLSTLGGAYHFCCPVSAIFCFLNTMAINKINITEKNIEITSENSYQELFSHL